MEKELLGNLFSVRSGDGIAVSNLSSFGKYPVFGGNGVNGYYSKCNVETGRMIIGRVGEKCGNINITDSESWISDNALIVTPKIDYNMNYMKYLLEHINLNVYANRNAQPVISGKIIYAIETPFIDDSQLQKQVADAIQSFDVYIDNLEELIEKKRNIREGTTEDLLSGRTRLKGFNNRWEEYPFDDFFTLLANNTLSRDKLSKRGSVGNIHYGDILIKYQNCVTNKDEIPFIKENIDTKAFRMLLDGDVVIADTAEDETVGKAIQIWGVPVPVVGGLHTIVCRPNYSTAPGFLGYYINSKCYHNQLYPHITGIKVSSISKKAIKTTFLKIPSCIDEQKEIVRILVAMDEEINELEKQRSKILQILEGAMDDLLTGRIRLKDKGGK